MAKKKRKTPKTKAKAKAAKKSARKSARSRREPGRRGTGQRAGSGKSPARTARPFVLGGPHTRLGGRKPLARELLALYGEIGRLSRAATLDADRLRLREQQDAIGVQIDEVIARTIREDTAEYRDAAIAIVAAARRIEDALADLSFVADAIVGAARVVDAVAKVLGAAVGPLP